MKRVSRTAFALIVVLASAGFLLGQEQTPPAAKPDTNVYREPFTLKLHVDKEHYYEERYDKKIPYVAENDIYLFSGEKFGVNLTTQGDEIVAVSYQPNLKKADVELEFTQKSEKGLEGMMLLVIKNKLKRRLYLDALMTRPGKTGIYKTSILPVEAGLSNFESWPHPIVQLVLRNLRFSPKPPAKAEQSH
jgi:hypothetical protein